MKEVFPTEKSILSTDGIKKNILSEYNLTSNCECTFIRPGQNDTYKVEDLGAEFYLRIYSNKWRTKNDIDSEIILINHLSKEGLHVAAPIQNKKNEFVMEVNAPEGIRYAVLFEPAIGDELDDLSENQSYNYGKKVFSIHASSDKLETLQRFDLDMNHLMYESLETIQPFLKNREEDFNYLSETAKALESKISELTSEVPLDWGICHGDFHHGNVFFDKEDNISVFDFDCFGYGWRSYDISVFLWSCVPPYSWEEESKRKRMKLWESFLKGYSSTKPLVEQEIQASFVFVAIRHIWFLGLQTQKSTVMGRDRLNDAYFDRAIAFIKKWIKTYKVLD